jgi:hypothetical protein
MYQPYPGSDTQLPEFLWRRSSTAYFKGTPA